MSICIKLGYLNNVRPCSRITDKIKIIFDIKRISLCNYTYNIKGHMEAHLFSFLILIMFRENNIKILN